MNSHAEAAPRTPKRAWLVAAITLAVLLLADYAHELLSRLAAYRALYNTHAFYVPEGIDKLAGLAVCVLTVWFLSSDGFRSVSRELGLSAPLLPAIAVALIVTSPMWIGFALTRKLTPHIQLVPLLFLTFFSPFVEEVEFRGFGVRYLQRETGWPFWFVVWPSALLFGFGHVEQGQTPLEMAGLFFLTGAGGSGKSDSVSRQCKVLRASRSDGQDCSGTSLLKEADTAAVGGLAAKGNPTALHFLFSRDYAPRPEPWKNVLKHKDVFLLRQAASQFRGFAEAQIRRLQGIGTGKKGLRHELFTIRLATLRKNRWSMASLTMA